MPKRIDPIRHWSIILFVLIVVVTGALLLPPIARYGGWSLEPKKWRDLNYTALTISCLFIVEYTIWKELLDLLQDWRDKRAKSRKNPYDQN